LVFLLCQYANEEVITGIVNKLNLNTSIELSFIRTRNTGFQSTNKPFTFSLAAIILMGLCNRQFEQGIIPSEIEALIQTAIREILDSQTVNSFTVPLLEAVVLKQLAKMSGAWSISKKQEFASLARELAGHIKSVKLREDSGIRESFIAALNHWADSLEGVESPAKPSRKPKSTKRPSNRTKSKKR
jgi:hypothetical protein